MLAVRRAVIFVAQILALIFIVVATMAGALAGDSWLAKATPMFGGIIALMPSAPYFDRRGARGIFRLHRAGGLFFLLIEIAYNTRNPFSQ